MHLWICFINIQTYGGYSWLFPLWSFLSMQCIWITEDPEWLLQTALKEEDNEEIEEANASQANAKGISIDVIVAAVLAELDEMFALKEGQR